MKYLKIEVNQEQHNLGGHDPEDFWSRDSYDGGAWVERAYLVEDNQHNTVLFPDGLEAGDEVHVILAVYTTGDSFGSDGGQYEIMDASKDMTYILERLEYFENVTDYSVPWNGYFEHLDGLKLTTHIVDAY